MKNCDLNKDNSNEYGNEEFGSRDTWKVELKIIRYGRVRELKRVMEY